MIKVCYEGDEYAYITQRSHWVNGANRVVASESKANALKQIAIDSGYIDIDFAKPKSDLDKYIKMIEDSKPKTKTKTKKNKRLKSSNGIALGDLLK